MDLGLAGKVAIVTGGSRGIGKACARALRNEGARVALFARDEARLADAREDLGAGPDLLAISVDTSDEAAVEAAVSQVVAAFGALDVVVNAAAVPISSGGPGATLDTAAPATVMALFDLKVMGYLRVIRAAVPHLRQRGGGNIVNISGMSARSTGSIASNLRNLSVAALSKNLADELGRENILVSVVYPGLTRTERPIVDPDAVTANGLGRIVDAHEIADVVTFLASPRSAALNGAVLAADGGTLGRLWT